MSEPGSLVDMNSLSWWPTLIVLAVATITDLRSRRIPNWLIFPFLLAGFVVAGWFHGITGIVHSVEGLVVGALFFGVLWWMGGMGMGDVKLCAAIGVWIGPSQMFVALVVTGIAGGVIAVGWALAGGFMGEMMSGAGEMLFGWKERGLNRHPAMVLGNPAARKMPYAPAIAIGTIISFFSR
jgi:prepilin peptidase CpaA